jgi:hypothetical protein
LTLADRYCSPATEATFFQKLLPCLVGMLDALLALSVGYYRAALYEQSSRSDRDVAKVTRLDPTRTSNVVKAGHGIANGEQHRVKQSMHACLGKGAYALHLDPDH